MDAHVVVFREPHYVFYLLNRRAIP
jgi:hypothetical protein